MRRNSRLQSGRARARCGPRRGSASSASRGYGDRGVAPGGGSPSSGEPRGPPSATGSRSVSSGVLFSEQVGSRHPRHLDDGQPEKVRIEHGGMRLWPTGRTTPAGRRRPRPISVLGPKVPGGLTRGKPRGVQDDHVRPYWRGAVTAPEGTASTSTRRNSTASLLRTGASKPRKADHGPAVQSPAAARSPAELLGRLSAAAGAKRDAGLVRAALLSRDRERQARVCPSPATPGAGPG